MARPAPTDAPVTEERRQFLRGMAVTAAAVPATACT